MKICPIFLNRRYVMKKKLIFALVALTILLACAVGAILFLENRPAAPGTEGTEAVSPSGETQTPGNTEDAESTVPAETTEATEEPIEISLPTEDPNDVMPEETFTDEDRVPAVTVDPDATEGTEDRESNETPPDVFETGD